MWNKGMCIEMIIIGFHNIKEKYFQVSQLTFPDNQGQELQR